MKTIKKWINALKNKDFRNIIGFFILTSILMILYISASANKSRENLDYSGYDAMQDIVLMLFQFATILMLVVQITISSITLKDNQKQFKSTIDNNLEIQEKQLKHNIKMINEERDFQRKRELEFYKYKIKYEYLNSSIKLAVETYAIYVNVIKNSEPNKLVFKPIQHKIILKNSEEMKQLIAKNYYVDREISNRLSYLFEEFENGIKNNSIKDWDNITNSFVKLRDDIVDILEDNENE